MPWDKIEERLRNVFKVKMSFPSGVIWLPDRPLTIDEWLISTARTDEEIIELNIPRIRFLQNRWRVEKLLELEWEDASHERRAISAMYVGREAYILVSSGNRYQLIAAVDPNNKPELYQAVISKLLQNSSFVSGPPVTCRNYRPDLVPDTFDVVDGDDSSRDSREHQPDITAKGGYLSKLLVGWIGSWIDLPVLGFWHEDIPDFISTPEKGKFIMKYNPTYGDKQREAQKRKMEEKSRTSQSQAEAEKPTATAESASREREPVRKDKTVD